MPVPPGSIHLHKHSPSVLHLPLWVSATGRIKNSQSSVAGVGLSLGENHFPTDSLTWRELLTGLTTCLFNHGPDNPLLQPVSAQFQQGEDNNNNNWSIPLRKNRRQQPKDSSGTDSTLQEQIGWAHRVHR
jgi:hypothetical protein